MSLGIPDLAVVAIITDALETLSKNPKHIEHILSMYCRYPSLQKLVGSEHIKDCVDYVTQNKIHVASYYDIDRKQNPSIVVVSSGTESDQFIGDHGGYQIQGDQILNPAKYASFDVKEFGDYTMSVADELKLEEKLWKNVYIANGDHCFVLDGILVREGEDTKLCVTEKIPEGLPKKGWCAQSSLHRPKGYVLGASIDDVTIQMKLATNGSFTIHRLLSIILRYCIKSRRMEFEGFGLQIPTFSYSPPMVVDPEEHEFESVFTMTCKFKDMWILDEYDLPDQAADIDVSLTATSTNEDNEDVDLE